MAEFTPIEIDKAKEFLTQHHWGILATRRKMAICRCRPSR